MKKLRILFIVSLFALLMAPGKLFALTCEVSQALGGPEECYTRVLLASSETTLVSQGMALVYDLDNTTPIQGAIQARIGRSSAENTFIAGIAQQGIASGQSAMILVRGLGFVRTTGGVVSGDSLVIAVSGNVATANPTSFTSTATAVVSGTPVAVALQSSTSNGTTARRAFVKIL